MAIHNPTQVYMAIHIPTQVYMAIHNPTQLYVAIHNPTQLYMAIHNLRSGVPSAFFRDGKERLIQLLDYSSVASPESGLFSDWPRNKRYLKLSDVWLPVWQCDFRATNRIRQERYICHISVNLFAAKFKAFPTVDH